MEWNKPPVRYKKWFALCPVKIGYEIRWLETVYVEELRTPGCLHDYYYENYRFLTKEEFYKLKEELKNEAINN